jgi:quercetin dioxygenase-like cupin family protein
MTDGFSVVDPAEVEQERFAESGLRHRKLTDVLGCTETRVNTITLGPGEVTAPHRHERQEEVYVALDGGIVRIEGTDHTVPPGGVVRVGPDPVRSVANDTDDPATWVLIGAPPVGTVADFGEYRMPEDA